VKITGTPGNGKERVENLIERRECPLCGGDESLLVKPRGIASVVQCADCGLVFQNAVAGDAHMELGTPEDVSAADEYSERFFRSRESLFRAIMRQIERETSVPGKLLDIGCGFGHLMRTARDKGWDVTGVDVTPGAIAVCRKHGLVVFEGTLEDLNPAPETFDAVTMIGVIEYLVDPLRELGSVARILKPGGVLVVRAINLDFHLPAHRIHKLGAGLFNRLGLRDPAIFHRFTFSPRNFRYCAERAGLRALRIIPSPSTRGDPYGYAKKRPAKALTSPVVTAVDVLARTAAAATRGRRIISTAFIAVCAKTPPPGRAKVLHVITRMDHGGSATDTRDIITGTDGSRFESHLVCGSLNQLTEEEERQLRSACAGFAVEPSLRRDISPLQDLTALLRLYRLIRDGGFDIVHTHTSKAGFIGRLAAWLAGAPIIVHSPHGHVFYGYFSPLKTKVFILLEKLAARVTDRLLCLTRMEIKDHLKLGVGWRGIFDVLPSGVPLEKFAAPSTPPDAVRRKLGIPPDAIVTGCVARLDPVKGIRHLILAFSLLADIEPPPYLLLVGDGEDREELERLAREKGVAPRVIFAGHRHDVPDLLHAMDVFALPSLNEGYGKAIVEAMCAGRPVVATAVGGVPSLVTNEETGLLVPPANPEALAVVLRRLISDPLSRTRIARAGLRSVSDDFSVEAMNRKLEEIYTNLLATRGKQGDR